MLRSQKHIVFSIVGEASSKLFVSQGISSGRNKNLRVAIAFVVGEVSVVNDCMET